MKHSKKLFLMATVFFLAGCLTACGSSPNPVSTTPAAAGAIDSTGNAAGTLPRINQLLIGSFKLEGTPQAIDSTQAAALLPLWQKVRELGGSASEDQAQLTALTEQIQNTMKPDQWEAILAMNLTQRDQYNLRKQKGGTNPSAYNGTPRAQAGNGAGATPDAWSGTKTSKPGHSETYQGQQTQRSGNTNLPTVLVDALIQLLQTRAGNPPAA
jgi:hypothetical protein